MGHGSGNSPSSLSNNPFTGLSPFGQKFRDILNDMAWRTARLDRMYQEMQRLIITPRDAGGGIGGDAGGIIPAKIIAIIGGPNATYDAEAFSDSNIFVEAAVPINRPLNIDNIDFLPADLWEENSVGGTCFIVQSKQFDPKGDPGDEEDLLLLVVFEEIDTTLCEPGSGL